MSEPLVSAEQARELLEAATPGRWEIGNYWGAITAGPDSVVHGYVDTACQTCGDEIKETAEVALSPEDAALIAAAPDLAATVIALHARLEAVRAVHARYFDLDGEPGTDDTDPEPEDVWRFDRDFRAALEGNS